MNLFKDKKGRVQKLILIFLLAIIILLIPVGIYADNATNTDDNSSSKQPLEELVSDIIEQEEIIENETSNETIEEPEINETTSEEIVNETQVETNESLIENVTINETEPLGGGGGEEGGSLNIEIQYPKKIIRGDTITLTAIITNTGNLEINSILVNWILPSGFESISENQEDFDILFPGDSLKSEISVSTSELTISGINEIKLRVYY